MPIDYAVKYSGVVDEKFRGESRVADLVGQEYDWIGAKTVVVYDVSTVPMGDYTRTGLSRYGTADELSATKQELTVTQDRAFTFTIDKMNEDETAGALEAGKALARQLELVAFPEYEKYVYGKMATGAGKKATPAAIDKDNVYDAILEGTVYLDENNVPVNDRFLVVSPEVYKAIKGSSEIILNTEIGQDLRIRGAVGMIDGLVVYLVPASLLPENAGFIVGQQKLCQAPMKLLEYKVHEDAPGISGKLVEGRLVYDAFITENKKGAFYYHAIA